ncbi:MAG: porin [Pseudomonadota bacterium]
MKIKTLLLGSAAVMVAVSGARAADAIIIEPEPVEYVRVCDAYGAGWWYIPGTETCIKFDGDVRVQYESEHYHDEYYENVETSAHDADYRARLNVRASNETEYGTLASRIRFTASASQNRGEGENANGVIGEGHNDHISRDEGIGQAGVNVDQATISIAGFFMGYSDSYWNRGGGDGYYNARYDGLFNNPDGLFFEYTYAANGFTATVGTEINDRTGEPGAPDVYGGITWSGGGLSLAGLVYYDNQEAAAAYRFRADYDLSSWAPGFAIGGWYEADNGDTDYVKGHTWGVTAKMNLTDNMVLFGGYSDYSDQYNGTNCNYCGTDTGDNSATNWSVGVAWNVVSGLLVQLDYSAYTFENERLSNGNQPGNGNYGVWGVRVVRSF